MARTTQTDVGKLVNKLNYSSHSNYGYAEDSCGRHILRHQITSKQFRLGCLVFICVCVKVTWSILFYIEYQALGCYVPLLFLSNTFLSSHSWKLKLVSCAQVWDSYLYTSLCFAVVAVSKTTKTILIFKIWFFPQHV